MSAPDVPTLQGQRCLLRALHTGDAASLQRHADNLAVSRNLFEGFPSPYTLDHALAWCDPQQRLASFGYVWGIEVDAQVVGCMGVRPHEGWLRCNAEVGYWLGQAYWGRGIAPEALRLATDWVWPNLPEITRLHADVFAWNSASAAVARKAGYFKESDMRRSAIKNGQVIDRMCWACLRPE